MIARRILFLLTALTLLAPMAQAEDIEVAGQNFPSEIELTAGDQPVSLKATGKALRKKFFFKVYAAVAYVDSSVDFGDDAGAAIIASAGPKQLHLRMLRTVDSEKITNSINEALDKCATQGVEAIATERTEFLGIFGDGELNKGENLRFTFLPGEGLQIMRDDDVLGTIAGDAFARAFFEIYFGPKPVNGGMKKDLLQLTD